jgi:hypothetical protein
LSGEHNVIYFKHVDKKCKAEQGPFSVFIQNRSNKKLSGEQSVIYFKHIDKKCKAEQSSFSVFIKKDQIKICLESKV